MTAAHPMTTPAPDLDARLQTLLTAWRARAFVWGVADCCQFARAALVQIHGVPADRLPDPLYTSEADALAHLESLGGIPGLIARADLAVRDDLADAQRGDLVLIAAPAPWAGALAVVGGQFAHLPGPLGLRAVPRRHWRAAFYRPVDARQKGGC